MYANGVEIERRYLVVQEYLPNLEEYPHSHIEQGYLSFKPTFRVRLMNGSPFCKGFITAKGSGQLSHTELESEISPDTVRDMMKHIKGHPVTKIRYGLPVENDTTCVWELDKFLDLNEGLWIAEIEIPHEEYEFVLPAWVGEEVTYNDDLKNAALAQKPWIYR